MPTLTEVNLEIAVRDGVDDNSTVQFKLYHGSESNVIAYYDANVIGSEAPWRHPLRMYNPLDKSQLNETTFYMEINAKGHDSFNGHLILNFVFSDGSKSAFDYGDFSIGTYRESNTTRKAIQV
ncbi:hypothetical protein GWR56_12985 [Mucilaginibacter sp. 14171R-50]|uniref:hypothetical protein n=1 Tax=Mucilaginibacter sp. 14171R-50 TaxID=2703789 RepID=UPI00138D3617|nr:hypothetical protein [Mucilaginibacter sp. 14171R-50]QHS56408.1 hypothetical protein GWR56_12985 [Mucilaginibacter sp. 14171R-50]